MNYLPEKEDKVIHNLIKYLYSISSLQALNCPILRSLYSTKRRLIELRTNIVLSSGLNRTSVKCQRCQMNLSDGPASYRIRPSKKQSKFEKKVLMKDQKQIPMTGYQRKYLKRVCNFSGNKLAITCKFCKKESFIKLPKPKKIQTPEVTPRPKKKKRKKDKFCGLNQNIVLSATSPYIRTLNKKYVNSSDINVLDPSKYKIKSKEVQFNKIQTIKETVIKNKNIQKKKEKTLHKLNELLKNQTRKSSPVSDLKSFLQSL